MIMKKYFSIFAMFLGMIFLYSCEKEITIELPEEPPKLVVEAWIEEGKPAMLILTKSAPYFSPIDANTLANSIVTNARAFVSDGITTEELTAGVSPDVFPFFVYSGNSLLGEVGKTYSLKVEWEGQEYYAETSIPSVVYLDSVWFQLDPGKDSAGLVYAIGTDNGAVNDYYRLFTKRLGKDFDFVPIFGSVWDDKFFNGESFTIQLYRGISSNVINPDADDKHFGHYLVGDTVVTRLCTMDYKNYMFWRTAESEIFSGGNPFSSTTSIPSNVSNGALGTFTGYGASYDTVLCSY